MKITKLKLVIIILLLILLAKIIISLVALPKASIDYVAQYNELTKPVDFNPENNAADDYLKAIDLYVEPSEELCSSNLMTKWREDGIPYPNDIDPNDLFLLKQWIKSNKPAMDQIKLAIQKPYCWFKRKSEKGTAMGITFPEAYVIQKISEALIYSARINAHDNNFRAAIDDLIDSYHLGQYQCRENVSIGEQYTGIRIKTDVIETALELLFYSKLTARELRYFQESLQSLIINEDYIPGIETEKLFLYDIVQHVYLDWIRGINKPSFRVLYGIRCMCGDHINNMWVNAFVGPSRHEILQQVDRFYDLHNQLRDKTPWEIHHQYMNELREIEAICESNFFMELFAHPQIRLFSSSQESNTQTEALIAVLAILRFKAENNRPPETLQKLVTNRYMKYLPLDPYSESALVYRVVGEDFRLYSFGKNFEDDNGEIFVIEEDSMFGSQGMEMPGTPSSINEPARTIKRTVYKDIVYWPVTDIPEYIDRGNKYKK